MRHSFGNEGLMCERLVFWSRQNHSVQVRCAARLACALLWIGCGSERTDTGSVLPPAGTSVAGASGGAAQSGAMSGSTAGAAGSRPTMNAIGGKGGTSADAGRGAAGAEAGGGAADTAGAGASGGAGGAAGSAAAAGDGTSPIAMFKRGCKDFDPGPCASFIPGGPYGAPEIELGPYGASLDFNVGKEFAYPIADGDADNDFTCGVLSSGQTSQVQQSVDYTLYSVYRPGQFNEGEKLPLIVWGDGTCAWPEAYGPLLRYVASHGFVVVAPNSRWVGDGSQMKKALDFMFAANDDQNSPYYQKLDTTKVGAMGHSQGGSGTIAVASDARVKAVIIWNGGTSASKPFLAITGDGDILDASPASLRQDIDAASVSPAAFLYYHMILQMSDVPGHLTLVTEPHRVVEPTVAWWKYILNDDAASKEYFAGTDCKLCNRMAEFEFGQKGL